MSHSNPDVAQESRITEKLTDVVKPEAITEFILEHRDGLFDESTLDAWLTKRKEDRPHRFIGDAAIPADVLKLARAGNITARGKCFVALGRDQAALDKLMAEKVEAPAPDPALRGKPNPWSAEGWSLRAQGDVIRGAGGIKLAHRLAEAAGVFVGATKPKRAA